MNEKLSLDETHVDELLSQALNRGCDTMLLEAGRPPCARRGAEDIWHELDEYERCKPQHIQAMLYDLISDEQITRFENELKLSFGYRLHGAGGRFLVLAGRDYRGDVAVSFRTVTDS